MARSSTRSAEVDRADRRAANSADKVKSPPKHENNVLLQSLVKHIEAEKIRKGSDYGVIASVMKERQAQYPWLKRGMLYHLMTTLDGVIKDISLHMGYYPSIGKAVRFDMKKNEWCKLENFQKTYDFIYEKLAEKGLAEVWETEKMLDNEGNEVTKKEDMYGRPTKYNLTHPDKLIFVDEVGNNTSQANDGNKTGTKYVTRKGWRAHQQNSFTDCHYTTLGFTAATGEPVMCAVIIAADRLKDHEKIGFNCCSPDWKEGMENWDDDQIGGLLTEEIVKERNRSEKS
jgi:hypothetical protein